MNNLQKAALVVGVATSFITTFAGSALNLAVPGMSVEFNMGAASAGWIVNIYTLVVAALAVPCGKVADSLGRRTFLIFGVVGFAIFSILVTFAPSTAILLILRALQAFAACFPGNVRVTFDSKIRSSMYSRDFLEPDLSDISATDAPNDMILEVKYDEFLPEVIRNLIQVKDLKQESFSKYGICRR